MLPSVFLQRPIAHRTLHDVTDNRPENSLAGARAAISAGYGIEIDIQMSQDGVPMVFHDYHLGRLADASGPVAQRTAAELGEIRLLGGDETIPTLAVFLRTVAGKIPMLVEIKDQDRAFGPNTGSIEQKVCENLRTYNGDAALMSLNPHTVAKCAKYAPDRPRGLATTHFDKEYWPTVPQARLDELSLIPDYTRVGASFISHKAMHLGAPVVADIASKGASILCWTITSPEQEAQARKIAQNITFEGYSPEF